MKFETRRERETRRKRQKQSAILGMVLAFALVMIMGAVIWSGKRTLEKQNKEYQARVAQLQERWKNSETGLMRLMNIKSISRPKNLQKKLQRTNSA